jgi:DNA polymerase-3 subunit delta'
MCREAIEANVAPLVALEAMTVALFEGRNDGFTIPRRVLR